MSARLLIEYDGGEFAGWARQPGMRTVQEEMEKGLARVLRRDVPLTVAGRTDAGVHARGQVASHDGEPAYASQLNGVLPPDVRVIESERAPDGFDARRDAVARVYRYRLFTRTTPSALERDRALHWPHPCDRELLERCAAAVHGTHDFTAFTPTQTYHQRFRRDIVRSEWVEESEHVLAYWIEADTFMRGMIRALVGTMLAVSGGRLSFEHFEGLLAGAPRAEAGDTAGAHGLYLESVKYP